MKAKQSPSYDHLLKETSPSTEIRHEGFNPSKHAFTSTLNFTYTPEEFELLAGLTEHIFY